MPGYSSLGLSWPGEYSLPINRDFQMKSKVFHGSHQVIATDLGSGWLMPTGGLVVTVRLARAVVTASPSLATQM